MFSAERTFVTDAASHLAKLDSLFDCADESFEPEDIRQHLTHIRESALPLQARAIAHSARLCADALPNAQKCYDNTRILSKLVDQYTQGLNEIDPDFIAALGGEVDPILSAASGDPAADHAAAARHLSRLIQFAPAEHQSALARLAGLKDFAPQPAPLPVEDTSGPADNTLGETLSETLLLENAAETAHIIPFQSPPVRRVTFEDAMQEVTTKVLGQARSLGKQVSVSYAGEAVVLPAQDGGAADHLIALLGTLASELVTTSIETPDVRRMNGLSGTAHLSFTASSANRGITVDCEWDRPGNASRALALDFTKPPYSAELKQIDARLDTVQGSPESQLRIFVPQHKTSPAKPKPLKSGASTDEALAQTAPQPPAQPARPATQFSDAPDVDMAGMEISL